MPSARKRRPTQSGLKKWAFSSQWTQLSGNISSESATPIPTPLLSSQKASTTVKMTWSRGKSENACRRIAGRAITFSCKSRTRSANEPAKWRSSENRKRVTRCSHRKMLSANRTKKSSICRLARLAARWELPGRHRDSRMELMRISMTTRRTTSRMLRCCGIIRASTCKWLQATSRTRSFLRTRSVKSLTSSKRSTCTKTAASSKTPRTESAPCRQSTIKSTTDLRSMA